MNKGSTMYVVYLQKFSRHPYRGTTGYVRHPIRGLVPCVVVSEPRHRWCDYEHGFVESLRLVYGWRKPRRGLVALHHVLELRPDDWRERFRREVEMVPIVQHP